MIINFLPYLPYFSTKFESMIFAICLVDENSNKASARKFIEEIERTGIRDGWARVKMMAKLNYIPLLVLFHFTSRRNIIARAFPKMECVAQPPPNRALNPLSASIFDCM